MGQAPGPIEATVMPCPFCGEKSITIHEGSTFRWMVAECNGCGATCGEVRVQTAGQGLPAHWKMKAEQDAVDEWNKRVLFDEPLRVIAVEAIREVTGCPDIKGNEGKYLVDVLMQKAREITIHNAAETGDAQTVEAAVPPPPVA